jgi:hypothetical protein
VEIFAKFLVGCVFTEAKIQVGIDLGPTCKYFSLAIRFFINDCHLFYFERTAKNHK